LKILDISLPVSPALPVWPGDSPVKVERYRSIATGDECNVSRLSCSVHSGTHVDAPSHFIDKAPAIDELPLEALIGPVLIVEVPQVDTRIEPEFLDSLSLPAGTERLLFKTRNSNLWRQAEHSFQTEYVALTQEAASWIVARGIRLVGIDYLSVQLFTDSKPLTHCILLQAGVVIIEGLNLRHVSPGAYQLVCLPLKLVGCDGAPARAVLIEG